MKPEKFDKAIAMRRDGIAYHEIAREIKETVAATKWLFQNLTPEIFESVKADYTRAKDKRENFNRGIARRKRRLERIKDRECQGPLSNDLDENDELVNEIFAGRKFESYRFRV